MRETAKEQNDFLNSIFVGIPSGALNTHIREIAKNVLTI